MKNLFWGERKGCKSIKISFFHTSLALYKYAFVHKYVYLTKNHLFKSYLIILLYKLFDIIKNVIKSFNRRRKKYNIKKLRNLQILIFKMFFCRLTDILTDKQIKLLSSFAIKKVFFPSIYN